MKKTQYSKEFETLWNAFDSTYGEKGSKKNAYKVFRELKVTAEDVDFIVNRLEQQKAAKDEQRNNGEFVSNFQHVERYLRNERWDDEISVGHARPTLPERETRSEFHDRKAQEYLRTLYGDDGDSLAGFVGHEAGQRTDRLN